MAEVNGYNPLKGKKRQLSQFLAEEMMYDFVAGKLDEERTKAVREYLTNSEQARELESQLRNAMVYCEGLSETEVSEPLMHKLVKSKSIFNRILDFIAWNKWPEATRWTLEAFSVSLVVAFVVAMSWPKISKWFPERQRDVVLAELEKAQQEQQAQISKADGSAAEKPPTSIIDVAKNSSEKPELASQVSVAKPQEKTPESDVKAAEPTVADAKVEEAPKVQETDETEEPKTEETAAAKPNVEKPKPKGFVYRAFMTLTNIDVVTEEIRIELQKLGGQKAGEVRMGWKKPKGSYFHFSIPESNYDAVVGMLRSFGPVQIAKDPHWRVMPEGKIRIILWVEDQDLKNKNP